MRDTQEVKSTIFCNNKTNFSKTIVAFTHNFNPSWLSGDKNTYYFSSVLKFNVLSIDFKFVGASANKTDAKVKQGGKEQDYDILERFQLSLCCVYSITKY